MLKENKFSKLYNDLQGNFPKSKILCDEPMSSHTTFKIGGPADIYMEPPTSEVVSLINLLRNQGIPFIVIGNGSNLLVSDEGIEGVVISLGRNASNVTIEGNIVKAEAGAMLSKVANLSAEAGLTGLEFASGIPGSIGGAIYMNAGAYGGEIKDILISATVLTADHQLIDVNADELKLSYRHSSLMENGAIVLEASLGLKEGDKEEILNQLAEIRQQRILKQPLDFPSAGSTFKRPEGYFAGKLIDDTGLRGYSVGGAQVSEKHCGFVVNTGDATCADVIKLMRDVDEKVFSTTGVHLEPEVRIIGRNVN